MLSPKVVAHVASTAACLSMAGDAGLRSRTRVQRDGSLVQHFELDLVLGDEAIARGETHATLTFPEPVSILEIVGGRATVYYCDFCDERAALSCASWCNKWTCTSTACLACETTYGCEKKPPSPPPPPLTPGEHSRVVLSLLPADAPLRQDGNVEQFELQKKLLGPPTSTLDNPPGLLELRGRRVRPVSGRIAADSTPLRPIITCQTTSEATEAVHQGQPYRPPPPPPPLSHSATSPTTEPPPDTPLAPSPPPPHSPPPHQVGSPPPPAYAMLLGGASATWPVSEQPSSTGGLDFGVSFAGLMSSPPLPPKLPRHTARKGKHVPNAEADAWSHTLQLLEGVLFLLGGAVVVRRCSATGTSIPRLLGNIAQWRCWRLQNAGGVPIPIAVRSTDEDD